MIQLAKNGLHSNKVFEIICPRMNHDRNTCRRVWCDFASAASSRLFWGFFAQRLIAFHFFLKKVGCRWSRLSYTALSVILKSFCQFLIKILIYISIGPNWFCQDQINKTPPLFSLRSHKFHISPPSLCRFKSLHFPNRSPHF